MAHNLKQKIDRGEILIGGAVNIFSPPLVEAYCAAGADFIMPCLEHSLKDYSALQTAIITADLHGVPSIVRPGDISPNMIGRLLDAGAAGIIFPEVHDAAEAAEYVSWCRYKPGGIRALGYNRSWTSGEANDPAQRAKENDEVVCIMVVEDMAGARNIEEILAVDGVAGIAIGPGDMALEIGATSWDDPRLQALLTDLAAKVRAVPGKALMRFTLTDEQAADNALSGANVLTIHHDVILIRNMYSKLISGFRSSAEGALKV